MVEPKISIITVAYNAQNTLERCVRSVIAQDYQNVEYIVIDGGSTDRSVQILESLQDGVDFYTSEPDLGVYDAMNRGIARATGDIIGMLNADDFFNNPKILSEIGRVFNDKSVDALYGDLNYVAADEHIVRKWRSGSYTHGDFNWGWMPPHPTFYCRRRLFEQYGHYKLDFGTAGDYELMLRFIHVKKIKVYYLKKVVVNMLVGGVSNNSFTNRLRALANDLKAMRQNGLRSPCIAIIFKPLRKISQFF